MIAQVFSAAAGIWLMISPFVLGFSGLPEDINHITGPVIASFAIISWWEATRDLRMVNIILGVLLIIAPIIFDFNSGTADINSAVTGIIVIILSFFRGKVVEKFGSGWKGLFD